MSKSLRASPTGSIAWCIAMTKRSRGGAADVVAFERRRRRQHDVGVARRRRPPRLVHDDGLRPLPGAAQPVEILMVVERIAAGPIDQPDVGIGRALAVVVVALAGMEQAVGDARRRDRELRRVGQSVGIVGPGNSSGGSAIPAARAVAEAEPAARQPDLAEARRQAAPAPNRAARHGRRAAATRTRSASCASPPCAAPVPRIVSAGTPVIAAAQSASFGWPSACAGQIRQDALEAAAIARQKRRIVAALRRSACAPAPASSPYRYWAGSGSIRARPPPARRRGSG